jgi:hypothetical protein
MGGGVGNNKDTMATALDDVDTNAVPRAIDPMRHWPSNPALASHHIMVTMGQSA